jgi:hypothetical protein
MAAEAAAAAALADFPAAGVLPVDLPVDGVVVDDVVAGYAFVEAAHIGCAPLLGCPVPAVVVFADTFVFDEGCSAYACFAS